MGTSYAQHLAADTPQSEPLAGQVANSAGGFSYPVDDWTRLDRFLVLGSEGGSYYASERKLTIENANVVIECVAMDGLRTVARILEISDSGRAPKNDPALLALALCLKHGGVATRRAALEALPDVARIGTHLFHLAEFMKALGCGWGRGTKRAFAKWYKDKRPEALVLQLIKYQQRDGWSHRDLLRKSHPKMIASPSNAALHWAVKGWPEIGAEPHPDKALAQIWAFERAKTETDPKALAKLIGDYKLPHECVPNEMKGHAAIWDALLPSMGLTAVIRNLGKMTSVGLLKPLSNVSREVAVRLTQTDELRRARIHPMQLLIAQRTYAQGHGMKGALTWEPDQMALDALDRAFYLAFKNVEPTNKSHLLALDVSGSMTWGQVAGCPLTPREGSAAMALVTANVESRYAVFGFSSTFVPIDITARDRLAVATQKVSDLPFSGTDCAIPMLHALEHKLEVDTFVIYTDSETWAGAVHPKVALERYRQKMGRAAKLVVCGMVSNDFSIADPSDAGQLDVVGFDANTPAVIADFAR